MRTLTTTVCLFLFASIAGADEEGFSPLFDGKSFVLDENSIDMFAEINALLSKYLPAEAK